MNPKILVFDIESSNLNANFGVILCISYKWFGTDKVHTIAITDFPSFKKDPTNDKPVVEAFQKVFEEADYVVAHFGEKFDVPMIQTKLLMHSGKLLPNTKLIDTWRISKTKLKLNSNRLETLISALGVKHKKTPLSGPTWVKAMAGNREAIRYVVEHCIADVKALEGVFQKLLPLIAELLPKSHLCDPKHSVRHGYRVAAKKTFMRMFCKKCGAWWKGAVIN